MIVKLKLADADRERFGCEEWIALDLFAVTAREAIEIQAATWPGPGGEEYYFDSPQAWREALAGRPVFDATGAPVMVQDWSEQDGAFVPRQKKRTDVGAAVVLVWLALKRVGVTTALADLDFNADALDWQVDQPTAPESPGKEDAAVDEAMTSSA